MRKVYIDVGSSTVKVYEFTDTELKLVETKSFKFKEGFDSESGISTENEQALIEYVNKVKAKFTEPTVKVFATALFRKLSPGARRRLSDAFYRETGLYFNVVAHDLEGHYLDQALSSEYKLDKPLLLMNIGGGSTELVVKEGGKTKHRYNLELGVGTVLEAFPRLNEQTSPYSVSAVVQFVAAKLPPIDYVTQNAIYNGGELTYMRLAGYPLRENTIFADDDHPQYIEANDFFSKNIEVFGKVTLEQLEHLMPADPLWMHGARACSAIAQAIVMHFGVKRLIPSDSNMIHGVVKQEHRGVVLSGSFRKHLDYILKVKRALADRDVEVLSPRFEEPKNPGEEFVVFQGEEGLSPLELERYHLDMIDKCDALVVCASGGYVGASALIEIGYAQALGKRVIFTETPEEFMLQTLPAEVGL